MLEVRVGLLDFGNLVDVLEAYGAHDVVAGSAGALLDAGSLLEKVSSGRSFCNEGEGAVRLDKNLSGNGDARFDVSSASVEFLAKIHGLDTTSTERRTDRRRGRRLASRDEETLHARVSDETADAKVTRTYDKLGLGVECRFRHGRGQEAGLAADEEQSVAGERWQRKPRAGVCDRGPRTSLTPPRHCPAQDVRRSRCPTRRPHASCLPSPSARRHSCIYTSTPPVMKFLALLALVSAAVATPAHSIYDGNAQELMMGDALPTSYPGFDLDLNAPRLVQLEGQEEPITMTELEKVCT